LFNTFLIVLLVAFVAADFTFSNLALFALTPLFHPSVLSPFLSDQTKAPRFIIRILATGDSKLLQLKQFVLMQSSINRLLIAFLLICR